MAKPKFKITLSRLPDFKLPVKFNMANGEEAEIVFTAMHKKPEEIALISTDDAKDYDFILGLCSGWDLDEDFNEDNVKELVSLFPGAALALINAYTSALAGQRVKN